MVSNVKKIRVNINYLIIYHRTILIDFFGLHSLVILNIYVYFIKNIYNYMNYSASIVIHKKHIKNIAKSNDEREERESKRVQYNNKSKVSSFLVNDTKRQQ